MSSNPQSTQDALASRHESLKGLEGANVAPKSLSSQDRAAINEALSDQTNIALLTEAGRSSQRERERRRREADRSDRA
ncbi:hypothetical protein BO78DRAFT_399805 [Aspergillus sclerotiicarbonarius CBS 121057]|uniref:Uncharacterized protein n=1 Tax=Aspergillus sclerotiicarbonarius (strain CBS 121057 / IBT 28362) TaxID=1448318 RepID=A0A319FBB4_ASPSB|nr:hypothetical protein BO78DRAFT_399805 [Aspergillus sclerotiicarbonarius CBS 121057]